MHHRIVTAATKNRIFTPAVWERNAELVMTQGAGKNPVSIMIVKQIFRYEESTRKSTVSYAISETNIRTHPNSVSVAIKLMMRMAAGMELNATRATGLINGRNPFLIIT
jgi:hypothetical protein